MAACRVSVWRERDGQHVCLADALASLTALRCSLRRDCPKSTHSYMECCPSPFRRVFHLFYLDVLFAPATHTRFMYFPVFSSCCCYVMLCCVVSCLCGSRNNEWKMIEGILKKYGQHGVGPPAGWSPPPAAGGAAPTGFGQVSMGYIGCCPCVGSVQRKQVLISAGWKQRCAFCILRSCAEPMRDVCARECSGGWCLRVAFVWIAAAAGGGGGECPVRASLAFPWFVCWFLRTFTSLFLLSLLCFSVCVRLCFFACCLLRMCLSLSLCLIYEVLSLC